MESTLRRPFQGVMNIIRFNWHFYAFAIGVVLLLLFSMLFVSAEFNWLVSGVILLIVFPVLISLTVSCYVYDFSRLYHFDWLKQLSFVGKTKIVNINAGFDETSAILKHQFPGSELIVFDFYDPLKHTEVSIARARKAYAPYPNTIKINTNAIPLSECSVDYVFNVFALHEVRDRDERTSFLRRQHLILKDDGYCILVEHLRDWPNFLAYNLGFFHFLSSTEWNSNITAAGFRIEKIIRITSFVSVFILKKDNGASS